MPRKDARIPGEFGEAPEAVEQGRRIAAGEIGASDPGDKKGIPRDEAFSGVQTYRARRMSRGVNNPQGSATHFDGKPIGQRTVGPRQVQGVGGKAGPGFFQNKAVPGRVVIMPVRVEEDLDLNPQSLGRG